MKKEHYWRHLRCAAVVLMIVSVSFTLATAAEQYGEAPMLQERVADGELPPIAERLPKHDDLYVVEPLESIGKYGGTLRTAGLNPEADCDDQMAISHINVVHPVGDSLEPNVAKSLETSEDAKTFTVRYREGMRWSDGEPFTTEDVMFWYDHILHNEDLTPVIGTVWRAEGEVMEMRAVDDFTLEVEFAQPKPLFPFDLVHSSPAWHTPKHYLKQFHPDFADTDQLEEKVREAGFDSWYELFANKNHFQYGLPLNPDLPTIGSYYLEGRDSERRQFVRNPYYWKVDSEGNQLPYIDRIDNTIVMDTEVYNGMVVTGQLDFAAYGTTIDNYPMYRSFEEEGNYSTKTWQTGMGTETIYMLNMTHEDPVMREIFQDFRFRKALSLALDRQETSAAFYFGEADPRQYTVIESHPLFRPEYAEAYIEHDPERAEELLDEMGLDQKDSAGFRLRPDGERLRFTFETRALSDLVVNRVDLGVQQMQELGLDARFEHISGELASQRAPANLMDANTWGGGAASIVNYPSNPYWFIPLAPGWSRSTWPLWEQWFVSDGSEGEEPPADIKELRDWWEELIVSPDPERRDELAHNILRSQAENLWVIGDVGNAPHAAVFSNDLRNIPDVVEWNWDVLWSMSHDPEQWFFDR